MICLDIAEGRIARFCGKQARNTNSGMGRLLSSMSEQEGNDFVPSSMPTPNQTPATKTDLANDLTKTIRELAIDLSEEVIRNIVLIENLVGDLNQVVGRIRALKVDI